MKEIYERTKVINTIRFVTTLVCSYCHRWQRFKSQIVKSKSYMTGIKQKKHMPIFIVVPRKFEIIRKAKNEQFMFEKASYVWKY